ncbi:uncharacterized protein LOC129574886 isoform X2 [Sitodiplosis mosellana]|uniref:uncharacterized protein LOC129574886 isoform X2 n=1 Tax=Sitodiplosis mosellana TaxID=263140 RepID=UPI002443AF48|nr:uncharacterized protein LOC129574886 isoform X2 [Sitodiplosis mosellana]XP_055313476.1 uncharacterized protein LOC129574886 isoform X2 [Sitodiplosis mosellana]
MILLNKFRPLALHNVKCVGCMTITLPRTIQLQITALQPKKADVIANLSEKLCCTEYVAKNIYSKFPLLRSIDVIKNDSLELLRGQIFPQSIVENPSLITMNIGILKKKIDLLNSAKPKKLDDFAPLLALDQDELNKLVARFLKEENEIEQGNRIYFLSEKLKIEPKVISKHRVNCGYELFFSSFRSFEKKINIVLDYGVSPLNILKGLYVLRCDDSVFVRRSERMISAGMPIKMYYFQLPEDEFDELIAKHGDTQKGASSAKMTMQLKKRNRDKAVIVESLKSLLECNDSDSSEIYYNYVNEINELVSAKNNIAYLLGIKVKLETIRENGFLLSMPIDEIEEKLDILKSMKPKNIEDFIPLMSVDTAVLDEYRCKLEKQFTIGRDHPIYYFSEQLEIPANVVATQFAEHRIVFLKYAPQLLQPKLDVLLQHDVDRSSILNCQNTFKFSVKKIEEVICKLKRDGFDKISSWMIILPDSPEHDKLVAKHAKEKNSLEGFESNMDYLVHRLGWNETDLAIALRKYPKLAKCSASKIKSLLDYLLNETQFTAADLVHFPYIFARNVDEIKQRIDEMTRIGAPITLSIIYQGKTN